MSDKIEKDDDYLNKNVFSFETTFHLTRKFNRYKARIWGTENPPEIIAHVQDSPKLKFICAVRQVYGPFLFAEPSITGISYLHMLENHLMPHLQQDTCTDLIFQQDGKTASPPPQDVTSHLNCTVAERIGRSGTTALSPRSPDITPLDFLCPEMLKTKFLFPLFQQVWKNYVHG
jgi:hypothetical protein